MKLSDYVIEFLEGKGVEDVFLLAGGGIMHLLDSLAKNDRINKYYNLHEQASGFAADGYAQYSNKLGVVFATTGPGATNLLTSVVSAHIDSTPMLVITGQVKTADITHIPGVRQTGAQEVDIVSMAENYAKYAVTVTKETDIRYVLEKAVFEATTGRPGVAWIDIPLDIQSKNVEINSLHGFKEYDCIQRQSDVLETDVVDIIDQIRMSQRPCILAGTGVILSGARKEFVDFVNSIGIPTVVSRRVIRLFNQDNGRFFYGSAGCVASRYANYVLQNSDLLLVIGSGLRYYLTAFDEENFAPKAKKIIINIHDKEIEKLRFEVYKAVTADAGRFIAKCSEYISRVKYRFANTAWIEYCDGMRAKYPVKNELKCLSDGLPDGYTVSMCVDKYSKDDDIYVASSSAYDYTYHMYTLRGRQDYICPIGLGSMGSVLPQSIGVCIASGKRRIIVGEGDGSIQHNIQELALLKYYKLPIKLFVDNNGGYDQIRSMQRRHFNGRYAGCDNLSGIGFPNLKDIAKAYGLDYYCIKSASCIEKVVREALSDDKPAIIEFFSSPNVEIVPAIKSRLRKDGSIESSKLEDMYPFLSEEEQKSNMKISQEVHEH